MVEELFARGHQHPVPCLNSSLTLTLLHTICRPCGFPLGLSNIWHVFTSKKMILKASILQNQSVTELSIFSLISANRMTPQNDFFIIILRIN